MKKSLFVGGIVFLIAGVGLKLTISPVEAETLSITQKVVNPTSNVTPIGKSQVELISAGAEPRQELRFKPTVGIKETANMTMSTDITMSIDGKAVPAFKIPTTAITLNTVVSKVEPNGDINYEFSYSDVDLIGKSTLPPEVLNNMQTQITNLNKFKGSVIIDNRGYTKKANFVTPQGLDPSLKQMFDQMSSSIEQLSSAVPQEAVGIGAKWRTISEVNLGGIKLKQIATNELVNIKDGIASLNISIEQQAPPATNLNLPETPKGVTITLRSYNGNGQGQALINLKKLMPISSKLSIQSKTQMSLKSTGSVEETTMNQDSSIQINIESK
ncbi:MAG: hypothetical protein KME38_01640 [Spirirestis rafaelensis WJT71-NPBG6]|jgi:hypothetical protein|nr:hypothetical protein [Spirirestis rafaelensis WJT71-NPBG6]